MAQFLNEWWGMLIFVLVDVAVLVLIIALNYRWLFKRTLDILFSLIFMAVLLPFFLIFLITDAIYNKATNAWCSLFTTEYFYGKKGKVVGITTFTTERILHDEEGNLLPEQERTTGFGRFMKACCIKYYPMLANVFTGRLSFVGPRPMTFTDASVLDEEGSVRFSVRPGIASSLDLYGGEGLTYKDMFEEDEEYVSHINLFRDIAFFMTKVANRVRGDKTNRYGETAEKSYIRSLLDAGEITEAEAEEYALEGKEKLHHYQNEKNERRDFEQRNFFR